MTERKSPHNQTTIPVLDQHGLPLAPARPSRVRQWLESGRATKVWIKGIFAVQLHDLNADTAITGNFALNMDPGETTGIAITRISRRPMPHHRRRLRTPAPQQGNPSQPGQPPGLPPHPPEPTTPPASPVQQPRQRPHQRPAATQHPKPGRRHRSHRPHDAGYTQSTRSGSSTSASTPS